MEKISKLASMILVIGLASTQAMASVELAKVNGKPITDKDLQMSLSGFNEGQRASILKDVNSRRQILSSLIDQELLVGQAEQEKIDQDKDFKDAVNAFRKQLLANRLVAKNLQSKITESAAKKYYDLHKSQFSTDEIEVQHILLGDEAKAKEVLKLARMPNADFMALAEKYSIDPSAKNNRGDIGMITHDSPFVPVFKDAAFAAKEGQVVGPVKTEYGYHLIKVVKKKIGRALNYDEVELKVKEALRAQVVRDYVNHLKAEAKITINDKAIEKM
jgi:parvulin-like peptidyl-prolyl isomerase